MFPYWKHQRGALIFDGLVINMYSAHRNIKFALEWGYAKPGTAQYLDKDKPLPIFSFFYWAHLVNVSCVVKVLVMFGC